MEFPKQDDPKFREKIVTYWEYKASETLLGKRIVKVEYFSKEEADDSMWHKRPICFQLEDGTWIIPQADDEGNDGGALGYTKNNKQGVLPVI